MPIEKVKFKSGGIHCAGDLYIPDGGRSVSRGPAVVMGHGFSFVKEALVEDAAYLQRAGYVVLAIDYRTFGESEGEPRGQLFPLNESEDYRNAISYLETRDEVDPARIGIWGTSFGGAMVTALQVLVEPVDGDPHRLAAAWLRVEPERIVGQQRNFLGLVGLLICIENVLDWMDHVVAAGDHDTQRARGDLVDYRLGVELDNLFDRLHREVRTPGLRASAARQRRRPHSACASC